MRTITLLASALLSLTASCGPAGGDGPRADAAPDAPVVADVGPDASVPPDAVGADAGMNLVGGCSPSAPSACRYGPAAPVRSSSRVVELSYTDLTNAARTIRVAVHEPAGLTGPTPVVVWSHGGADGSMNAAASGAEWAEVFTAAGYLSVHIAHTGRTTAERSALCQRLGYDAAACATFKYLSWDRPHDVRRVLDWVEEQARGPMGARIDVRRIAYAGHSAGAGAALVVAGATRDIAGTQRALPDPRPVAFVSCSPQGPGEEGFVEGSFGGVTRPHLTLSGVGDDTDGVASESRRRPFELVAPGNKYRLWITEDSARHTTFDFSTDACVQHRMRAGQDVARCRDYLPWLSSAMVAFLDANLRDSAAARAWLASDNAAVLSGRVAEWSRR